MIQAETAEITGLIYGQQVCNRGTKETKRAIGQGNIYIFHYVLQPIGRK
jgi:hypothetical protein